MYVLLEIRLCKYVYSNKTHLLAITMHVRMSSVTHLLPYPYIGYQVHVCSYYVHVRMSYMYPYASK